MGNQRVTAFFRLLVIALLFGLAIVAAWLNHIGWALTESEPWLFFSRAATQLGPLAAFYAIAVIILSGLLERQQLRQLKTRLISQLSSRHNDVTEPAIAELRAYEWLNDGSLHNVNLRWAGLEGSVLQGADLRGARLELANLSGADLRQANLASTRFSLATLLETDLRGADLRGADMRGANLRGARLEGAKLEGTDLRWAILDRAQVAEEQLEMAAGLAGATMPDGVRLQDKEGQPAIGVDPFPNGPTFADWLAGDWQPPATAAGAPTPTAAAGEPTAALPLAAEAPAPKAAPEPVAAESVTPDEPPASILEPPDVGAPEPAADPDPISDVELPAIKGVRWYGAGMPAAWQAPDAVDADVVPEASAEMAEPPAVTTSPAIHGAGVHENGAAPEAPGEAPSVAERVRQVTQHGDLTYQAVYAELRRAFGVASYREIPDERLPEVFALLDRLAGAGTKDG